MLSRARYSVQFQPDGTRDVFVPVKCYIQTGFPFPGRKPFSGYVLKANLGRAEVPPSLYCLGEGRRELPVLSGLLLPSWKIMVDGT